MIKQNIKHLLNLLETKQISATELTKHYLEKAKKLNPKLNAFITLTEENALAQAERASKNMTAGLAGIPMAHKDLFCTSGVKTSCGSKMLDNFISPYDATIVDRLANAGAVMLGKLNMDEFAMGSANLTSYYGRVLNPHDISRIPGGSSGGSVSAVASDMAVFASGSDTGGSIRQPASFCGVVGLKPTYGVLSRYGMIAFASSLDTAGFLTRSAEDMAYAMKYSAGFDAKDSTSSKANTPDYVEKLTQRKNLKGIKIGVLGKEVLSYTNEKGASLYEDFVKELVSLGAEPVEISIDFWKDAPFLYKVIGYGEAVSNLARFDGIRFGYSQSEAEDFIARNRSEGFGLEVKRRIIVGTTMLLEENYQRFYMMSLRLRRFMANKMQELLSNVDVVLTPATPDIAPKFGNAKVSEEFKEDMLIIPANMAGVPAISVPMGFQDGMPRGMQLVANHHRDDLLLQISHLYQQKTDHHLKLAEV